MPHNNRSLRLKRSARVAPKRSLPPDLHLDSSCPIPVIAYQSRSATAWISMRTSGLADGRVSMALAGGSAPRYCVHKSLLFEKASLFETLGRVD
jgi:hypothetical protein